MASRFRLASALGLVHLFLRDITERHMCALAGQLDRELASHAGAATGYDGELASKVLHRRSFQRLCDPECTSEGGPVAGGRRPPSVPLFKRTPGKR